MKKRSHRQEKMARVYDEEILPIWSLRFGRMLLRGLTVPPKAMVLDVCCGTGYPALELLKRMDEQGRIIALDPIGALLDVARKKAGPLAGKRIFFRSEAPVYKLSFADEVYDLVLSNLGLLELDDPQQALQEFARVVKVGGQVIVTLPLAGTYQEFYDIYREVLTKHDLHEMLERLDEHLARTPDAETVATWFACAGLQEVKIEVEQFSLLFKSSREFFFAPVIEFGPLRAWKVIAGKGSPMQEVFWEIKAAIDAYFGDRAFEITVKAGCCSGCKPRALVRSRVAAEDSGTATAGEAAPAARSPSRLLLDDFALDEGDGWDDDEQG